MKTLLSLLMLLFGCRPSAEASPYPTGSASHPPNFSALADALYHAEGGAKARVPYGILSVRVRDHAEARRACLRTVERAWRDWRQTPDGEFVDYLCDRYCPRSDDPQGNKNLKRNVRYFLHHPKPVPAT